MIRYLKVGKNHVRLEYQPRDTSLFRLCVAWLAALAGCALFVAAAVTWGLK